VTSLDGGGPVRITPSGPRCQMSGSRCLIQSVRDSHISWTRFWGPLTTNKSHPFGALANKLHQVNAILYRLFGGKY
jgi:hypothetical protein